MVLVTYDDSNDYSYSSGNSSSGYSDSGSGSDSSGGLSSSDGAQVAEAEFLLAQIMVGLKMGLEELKIIMIHLTGDTWDANGNYSGNMNDWLWD